MTRQTHAVIGNSSRALNRKRKRELQIERGSSDR